MTYPPCNMPSQARCERVPPAHGPPALHQPDWDAVDLRTPDDLPLDNGVAMAIDLRLLVGSNTIDPRTWCRSHVAAWVSRGGGLPERFPMNGKALCLMTRDMFAARVPGQGFKLHFDFRRRLAKALALQELIEKMSANYD